MLTPESFHFKFIWLNMWSSACPFKSFQHLHNCSYQILNVVCMGAYGGMWDGNVCVGIWNVWVWVCVAYLSMLVCVYEHVCMYVAHVSVWTWWGICVTVCGHKWLCGGHMWVYECVCGTCECLNVCVRVCAFVSVWMYECVLAESRQRCHSLRGFFPVFRLWE